MGPVFVGASIVRVGALSSTWWDQIDGWRHVTDTKCMRFNISEMTPCGHMSRGPKDANAVIRRCSGVNWQTCVVR